MAENYEQAWHEMIDGRDAEIGRLVTALFKIQCEQLRIASATDMTRPAMREAAMETRNEIIEILKPYSSVTTGQGSTDG